MKKIVALLLVVIMATTMFCACGNMRLLDTTYSFEYAYIALPNGEVVEGRVSSWADYEGGDVVQVVINGKTYLTHYENVVLVSD
jgi:hypothetical protein